LGLTLEIQIFKKYAEILGRLSRKMPETSRPRENPQHFKSRTRRKTKIFKITLVEAATALPRRAVIEPPRELTSSGFSPLFR
jgi:hypothetical protein